MVLPAQIWFRAVTASQVANLLATATACGSAWVMRGDWEPAHVHKVRKPLALRQPLLVPCVAFAAQGARTGAGHRDRHG